MIEREGSPQSPSAGLFGFCRIHRSATCAALLPWVAAIELSKAGGGATSLPLARGE